MEVATNKQEQVCRENGSRGNRSTSTSDDAVKTIEVAVSGKNHRRCGMSSFGQGVSEDEFSSTVDTLVRWSIVLLLSVSMNLHALFYQLLSWIVYR